MSHMCISKSASYFCGHVAQVMCKERPLSRIFFSRRQNVPLQSSYLLSLSKEAIGLYTQMLGRRAPLLKAWDFDLSSLGQAVDARFLSLDCL